MSPGQPRSKAIPATRCRRSGRSWSSTSEPHCHFARLASPRSHSTHGRSATRMREPRQRRFRTKPASRPTIRSGSVPVPCWTPSCAPCNPDGRGSVKNRTARAARLTTWCALAALALAPAAGADIGVGVADDHAKESPAVAELFYDTMKDVGLNENRITILWDSSRPTTIEHRDAVAHAIDAAAADGIRVTLALYPERARAITEASSAPGDFAAWVALVARTFPRVKDFIIGNEPNKARFWQPQFHANGKAAACTAYQSLLAASYDALKAVDQNIIVIGMGLGPRGTDNPRASGNLSISPVRCIRDLG